MRILFASTSSGSRGGGEIFLRYLAAALREHGHVVALWISNHPRMDELAARFAPIGDVLRSDYTNLYDTWHRGLLGEGSRWASRRYAQEWSRWNPDIVHVNKQCLEDGLDLLAATEYLTVPHLSTLHITQTARGLGARLGALRDRRARRALMRYAGPLVAVAAARTENLRTVIGPRPRIETILNGVPPAGASIDRTELRASEGIAADAFAFVAVGRLEEQKRPLEFLAHLQRARQSGQPVTGRWVGGGRLEAAWDAEVARLGLASVVHRDPWRDDVARILPAFDAYLHPAQFEGLPLALLEAMQAGLPCFVSAEVARDLPPGLAQTTVIVDRDTRWADWLTDATARQRLAAAGQALVRSEYSTQAMAANYEALYLQLQKSVA